LRFLESALRVVRRVAHRSESRPAGGGQLPLHGNPIPVIALERVAT